MQQAYLSERKRHLEYRYGFDGSLTILNMRRRAGTNRTVLYVPKSPATAAYLAEHPVRQGLPQRDA